MSATDARRRLRRRSIAWRVNGPIVLLAGLLIGISLLAIATLASYRDLLTGLTGKSLPEITEGAEVSAQLGGLLLLTERLAVADSEPLRRVTLRELNDSFDRVTLAVGQISDHDARLMFLKQLDNLRGALEDLDRLVEARLTSETLMTEALARVDSEIGRTMGRLLDFPTLVLALAEFRSDVHAIAHGKGGRGRRAPQQAFSDALAKLQDARDGIEGMEGSTPAREAMGALESAVLGKGNLSDLLERDRRTAVSNRAQSNLVRGIVDDVNAGFSGRFIANNRTMYEGSEALLKRAGVQSLIFYGIAAVALLLGFGMWIYVRRKVTGRLLAMDAEVRARVEGSQTPITAAGDDEIAAIARTFNYFAHELSLAKEAAEASNEAKSRFLANVSHEVRTPLNTISGMSYLARQQNDDPKVTHYLEQIDQGANHLLNVINDILDISRAEAGRIELTAAPFSFPDAVRNVVAILQGQADKAGIELRFAVPDSLSIPVIGDSLRLQQVLINLLGNSIKFTSAGWAGIFVDETERTAEAVTLEIRVQDTGIGIAPEVQKTLFQNFHQGDSTITRRYGGSGLGLAISRSLIELMGGTLSVESEVRRGSTFTACLSLPFATHAPAIANDGPAQPGALHGRADGSPGAPSLILVAEDQIINREMLREIIEGLGCEVAEAENGAEVLSRLADQAQATPDLVLMDLQMPVLDGVAATRQLRQRWDATELPIIGLSAHAGDADRERCLDAGMNDYLTKPLEINDLASRLQAAGCAVKMPTGGPTATPGPETPDPVLFARDLALSRCKGNAPLLRRLVGHLSDEIGEFVEAIDGRDPSELGTLLDRIHSLRGACANLGTMRLAQALTDAERHVRDGRGMTVDELHSLTLLCNQTVQCMREAAPDLPDAGADGMRREPARASDDEAELERLESLLAARDLEAGEHFALIEGEVRALLGAESGERIGLAIAKLDFDAALQVLKSDNPQGSPTL